MNVLITGGAGYIGSHTCLALLQAGHCITVLDNFANSTPRVLDRLKAICGRDIALIQADLKNSMLLEDSLKGLSFDAVIHFAGLKSVSDSIGSPATYYENNLGGTLNLLQVLQKIQVRTLVFSSSAAVYGLAALQPVTEQELPDPFSPYGKTKFMVEQMLRDFYSSEAGWRIASLRYFNPAGAYPGGALGMIPGSDAGNLMSRICSVAQGVSPYLSIYGGDYLTADGTGVRDYIHVQDLADAHLSALNYLGQTPADKCVEINVGTGFGTTVLELLRGFESVTGKQIPYRITGRRAGDVGVCYADVRRAEQLLGWKSKRPLEEICKDAWFYASRTPERSLGN